MDSNAGQYGCFNSNEATMIIEQPLDNEKTLVLIETEHLFVTTRFVYFKNFMLSLQSSKTESLRIYATNCLEMLDSKTENEIMLSSYVVSNLFFQKFLIRVFRNSLCFIWNKELNTYLTTMIFYERTEHPAPCAGFKKAFYAVNGKAFFEHVVSIF